jgi:GLPGLI family protein
MIHFKTILILCICLISVTAVGQNIIATYNIERNVTFNGHVATLSLKGHYYKKGNNYIYWETPLYLLKYPKGEIEIADDDRSITIFRLNADTIQNLVYSDYDSLITRQGLSNQYENYITEFTFEENRSRPWIFETQTKVINGMKCQLAIDRDQWRVWFCPDIPVKTNLIDLPGLPGLIIEADWLPVNEHFSLLTYDMPSSVDEKIFMPAIFKQPMVKGGLLKSIKTPSTKTKLEKQQDLINQNN